MTGQPPTSSESIEFQALILLLDEWKFRQRHCWAVLERFGLIALLVSVAPYTVQDLVRGLGASALLIPIIGWIVAVWALWLFGAEYLQCNPVLQTYRASFRHYPKEDRRGGIQRIFDLTIGWVTAIVLFVAITLFELFNGYVLYGLVSVGTGS